MIHLVQALAAEFAGSSSSAGAGGLDGGATADVGMDVFSDLNNLLTGGGGGGGLNLSEDTMLGKGFKQAPEGSGAPDDDDDLEDMYEQFLAGNGEINN